MSRYDEILAEKARLLALPCSDEAGQAVHDRLARFDLLFREKGHTGMCAVGMVWGGKACNCNEV